MDTGTSTLAKGKGATITEGLDGLGARLAGYAERGAAFAKWRAVLDVRTASPYAIETNAHALGRYAALCQEHGVVPAVEPEVLCTGSHDIAASADVTDRVLAAVFDQLERQRVDLAGIVLKPNMVTPGLDGPPSTPQAVAAETIGVLGRRVRPWPPGWPSCPAGTPTSRAAPTWSRQRARGLPPWALTFSFGRALVSDALRTWKGDRAA